MEDYPAVVSRIKLLAGLDIAERRQAQDGRVRTRSGGREVDIRVSVIPVLFGEDIVLRLLDQERHVRQLAIQLEVVVAAAVVAEFLAVVRGDDQDRLPVPDAELAQRLLQEAVEVADLAVVGRRLHGVLAQLRVLAGLEPG